MSVKTTWARFRSAITGRFVTKAYAQQNPDNTVAENPRHGRHRQRAEDTDADGRRN